MIQSIWAWLRGPRGRPILLGAWTGVALSVWAVLVRLYRGPDAVNHYGWTLTSLVTAYLASCTFVGVVVAAVQRFAMKSGVRAALTGALTGAVVIPGFFLPTGSIESWYSDLAWLVAFGVLGGAYGGLRLRGQVMAESRPPAPEDV